MTNENWLPQSAREQGAWLLEQRRKRDPIVTVSQTSGESHNNPLHNTDDTRHPHRVRGKPDPTLTPPSGGDCHTRHIR